MKEQPILEIQHLFHSYGGRNWAVNDISFTIAHTGITGLLGSNGAGKSTTMNIICGVLNQTKGKVLIEQVDINAEPLNAKKHIGFLPQQAPLHLDLTVQEYLAHCAALRHIPAKKIAESVEIAKAKCGIMHFSNRLISNLSGGYRQRVGIAQAIIHEPKLVILDEPTNGLDPNQIYEIRKLIKEIGEERAVIFSSHILSEIQATCKDVIMIEKGNIVFQDTMQAFNDYAAPNALQLRLANPPLIAELLDIDFIIDVELIHGSTFRMTFIDEADITEKLIQISLKKKWGIQEIFYEKNSLDEIFAQLSNKQLTNWFGDIKTNLN